MMIYDDDDDDDDDDDLTLLARFLEILPEVTKPSCRKTYRWGKTNEYETV